MAVGLQLRRVPAERDLLAPDGSEIRLLASVDGAGLCHCTLPVGAVSAAVAHRRVEELWYTLSGRGEVWRSGEDGEEQVEVSPGTSLNIPSGVSFQFRNTGAEPLCFVIATIPPWPGPDEALPRSGPWR